MPYVVAAVGWFLYAAHDCPPPAVSTTHLKENVAKSWSFLESNHGQSITNVDTRESVRIVTRTVYLPGQTTVERVEERGTETRASESRTEEGLKSAGGQAEHTVELEVKQVDLRRDWHVSALGGLDLQARPLWGASVSRRVLSIGALDVTAGAWALPSAKAGGISIGVTW